jgi:hypothetical protein
MKTKIIALAALLLGAQMGTSQVVHVWEDPRGWWEGHWVYGPNAPDKFTMHELSLDLFGSYIAGQRSLGDIFDTSIRDGKWGGGVGLNYFLTREIGLGADINMSDNRGNLVDIVQASLIGRLPSETTGLAPYIFGGGGRGTDRVWEWTAHAGLGLEFRMNPLTGIFVDGRYIWADKTHDALLLRSGLRLVF